MSRLLQGALAGQGWAQALHHHLALLPLTSHHPWHVQQWNPFGNTLDALKFNYFLLNSLALTCFCPCPPCVQCHSPVGGSWAQLHQWPFPTCCSRGRSSVPSTLFLLHSFEGLGSCKYSFSAGDWGISGK